MHMMRQVDYYSFDVDESPDDSDSSSRIRLRVTGVDSGQNADLRVTLRCGGSGGTYGCNTGDFVTNGCESTLPSGTDEDVDLRVNCDDDDVEVTVRVQLVGGGFTSCAPYTLAREVR
jgi:hypothetical protein